MPKYGKKAEEKVEKAMHEYKRGELRSSSGDKVTSSKQAIAIGLSEAREAGGKVPARKSTSGKTSTASKRASTRTRVSSSRGRSRSTMSQKRTTSTRKTSTAARPSTARKHTTPRSRAKKS